MQRTRQIDQEFGELRHTYSSSYSNAETLLGAAPPAELDGTEAYAFDNHQSVGAKRSPSFVSINS
jgi:hypothetical protein